MLDRKYDIIVADNLLGDGDFKDLIALIQLSPSKDVPVIIYTATVKKIDKDEVRKLGNIVDVLTKPFVVKDFLAIAKKYT